MYGVPPSNAGVTLCSRAVLGNTTLREILMRIIGLREK